MSVLDKNNTTIGIITKDRPDFLNRCLKQLRKYHPFIKIIVVDNSVINEINGDVKKIVESYSGIYIHQKKIGYPFARNSVLEKVKTKWLYFIDDDCLLKKSLFDIDFQSKDFVACNLLSEPISKSVYSYLSTFFTRYWLETSLVALDTKNCIINVSFLKRKKIKFNESLVVSGLGGSEDVNLALDIVEKKGVILVDENILVRHNEPNNLKAYIQNIIKNSSNLSVLNALLTEKQKTLLQLKKTRLFEYLKTTLFANSSLSFFYKTQISFLILLTILFYKILYFIFDLHYYRLKKKNHFL